MEGVMEGESKSLLITMSDDEILKLVSATHDDPDQQDKDNTIIDLDTLFSDTGAILEYAFEMFLDAVYPQYEMDDELVDPRARFSTSTLWTAVKSIGLEMSCEDGGDEIVTLESRTLQVLKKLSKYSWEAKVALAVASFALDYVQSDLLNKSVGILKHSTDSTNSDDGANLQLKPCEHPILEAIRLIRRTLELKPFHNEMTDIEIPVQVYWIIAITIACATQIKLATSQERKKAYDLSQFSKKLSYLFVYQDAERVHSTWNEEIGEFLTDGKTESRTERLELGSGTARLKLAKAVEVFRVKILPEDSTVKTVLIDGSTGQPVDMNVLKGTLLLLFSGLDISEESDLSPLKIIYEETKQKDTHKIVWIPMVESSTEDRQRQYEKLRSKMPWYILQCSSPLTTAMRFITKECKFKGKPILVVMNPYGTVKNTNALPLIRKEGIKALPFYALHDQRQSVLARIMKPLESCVRRSNK